MNILRNRFLNTAAFLSAPDDPPAGGKKPVVLGMEDVTDSDDSGDVAEDGQNTGDAGDDASGDDGDGEEDSGSDDKPAAGADDDDPDLAELPPEVRAKAKAVMDKRILRETGWRDRQIDRLYAKRRLAEAETEAASVIVANRAAGGGAAPENLTQAQIEQRATELAKGMTAQQQYDRDANDADARGASAYGDKWRTSMAQIPKLGGLAVHDMVDILNTDQPHVVLYSLTDPEVYERVMALSPARRRNEFVKLSLKEAPKPRVATGETRRPGAAPPPVVPVGGGRRVAAQQVNLHDDKTPDDKWYEARNATRRKKFSEVQ